MWVLMKNILKTGPVAAFILGDQYMVVASEEATDWDLIQAITAEEELQLYREGAQWN